MNQPTMDVIAQELLRQSIQKELDAERTAEQRNQWGQFATPNELALEIARCLSREMADTPRPLHFADPALGSGSFYSAALAIFGQAELDAPVGIELDPRMADAAQNLWQDFGLTVLNGDFTRLVESKLKPFAPNLILANPPYVRHHHLPRAEKVRLQTLVQKLCGLKVSGLAGLYVYFLLLATHWMAERGTAAWLIPSEFMDVNYGETPRLFLTDRVTLDRIHRFDASNSQFNDALVSSAILFFRKQIPPPNHQVNFTLGGTLSEPDAQELVPLRALQENRKWTSYPAHDCNDRRRSRKSNGPVLANLFRIQRGIATGCNKFFILERSAAARMKLPTQCLRPILPSPRHLKQTTVESEQDGYPVLAPQLCVIDCDLPEPTLITRYPALWEYLRGAEPLGIREGYLIRKRSPWYKQERRAPAPYLCTYMGRGTKDKKPFRFIWNKSEAIGSNLYLMLYPTPALANMLENNPERKAILFQWLEARTGDELRGEGRVYGGGLNKIEPRELGQISAKDLIQLWPELEDSIPSKQKTLFT